MVSGAKAKASVLEGDKADEAYEEKFRNRIYDVMDNYQPELLYFDSHTFFESRNSDDLMLSHFYNSSQNWNEGVNKAVVTSKGLSEKEQDMWVLDFENSHSGELKQKPWQTDIGYDWWFYFKQEQENRMQTQDVIHTLIDIVSKNGNMLLNICQTADGEIRPYAYEFLDEMGDWMDINSEAIHGTRPWTKFGEGPMRIGGKEHKKHEVLKYTSEDFRFTTKGDALYAVLMAYPSDNKQVVITSLSEGEELWFGKIKKVELLGQKGKLKWKRTDQGLEVKLPENKPCKYAYVIKITGLPQ